MASLSHLIGPLKGEDRQPLYQQLQRALRAAIDRKILAPDALPEAGLLVERRGFLADGRAGEFSQSFYRGDAYDFVAERGDLG